ncbi:putative sulfate exporter family transporter [Candidatus Magnetominusculus dajiuhuensis]|uniref:putative sulfate exporter family transporter n=1 Tax=Candidatus Magnetominusculus dajiuhuensis TaxID=3137712 RepID=UPI003B428CFD
MEEKTAGISEDWLSLFLGVFIFMVSLGLFMGHDLMGWGISTSIWTDPTKAMSAISKKYKPVKGELTKIDGAKLTLKLADGKEDSVTAEGDVSALKVGDVYEKKGITGVTALFLTYAAMLIVMLVGARLMGINVGKFAVGFTVLFWLSYLCWFTGHYAHIAATKNQLAGFKINWALSLTPEAGFIVALIAGLIVGNFFPKLSGTLKEAARPELYIKTAIVIMGAMLGLKAAESFTLASAVLFRGLCAIVEAYLIYWAVVYYVARKYFKFSSEWAAPLAAGISICGVSAAIAVGGAIRARPIVPIMVSSLVVIFAVVEMLILPFAAQIFLWSEPLVAGAWMGLAVKTDGGAVASGAITDALIRAKAMDMSGINYEAGWITMASTTVKMFIDIFIGVWAFVLAIVWCTKMECKPGEKVKAVEIWQRFPKFVIGYVVTFLLLLFICFPSTKAIAPVDNQVKTLTTEIASLQKKLASPVLPIEEASIKARIDESKDKIKSLNGSVKNHRDMLAKAKLATDESNTFRVMFFVLTFFSIGLVSNFKKLWEEGIGKLAVVYVICLFGFIIWVGLFISWLFFHGVKPPIVTG